MSLRGTRLGKGRNAIRQMHSDQFTHRDEIQSLRSFSQTAPFVRAVVYDIIINPDILSDTAKDDLRNYVSNPSIVDSMPRDSILAMTIDGKVGGSVDPKPEIFIPFFSAHHRTPIKPGEHVWIYYANPNVDNEYGYWFSRAGDFTEVEDLNYTHSDRIMYNLFYETQEASTVERHDGKNLSSEPGFPNGLCGENDDPKENNLITIDLPKGYNDIFDSAKSQKIVFNEPVPRFTKRPGDYVLQGSNNSLIWMGSDRSKEAAKFDSDGYPTSINSNEYNKQSATIDIVVGRGRGDSTKPKVVENSKSYEEVDKEALRMKREINKNEGDLDFSKDASRVLISQKTKGDENFNIPSPQKTDNSPQTDDKNGNPYVVVKSDEIRILARKDDDLKSNGSIRLVKEGEDGNDRAILTIHPDGTIQLDAPKIVLGRNDSNAQDTGYVKYSEYKKRMDNIHSLLKNLTTAFDQLSTSVQASSPPPVIAFLTGGFTTFLGIIKSEIEFSKQQISKAKSDTIFGE